MAKGEREITIKERGVVLTFTIRKQQYNLNPSPAAILRLSEQFGRIRDKLKREAGEGEEIRDPNANEQAEIADLLLTYLSGEHETFFRSLPTEMQGVVVSEMWRWYMALDMPPLYADPTLASSPLRTTREPHLATSSSGTLKPSPGSNEATAPERQ